MINLKLKARLEEDIYAFGGVCGAERMVHWTNCSIRRNCGIELVVEQNLPGEQWNHSEIPVGKTLNFSHYGVSVVPLQTRGIFL